MGRKDTVEVLASQWISSYLLDQVFAKPLLPGEFREPSIKISILAQIVSHFARFCRLYIVDHIENLAELSNLGLRGLNATVLSDRFQNERSL
ncbi:MAG TPA: hypothetical protein VM912_21200, partial [Terriglobales bacterium]|nr:hypothetical protein [Terriglobales bacterium]